MHSLLASVEAISSCRDREALAEHLVAAVATVLGAGRAQLHLSGAAGEAWQAAFAAGDPGLADPANGLLGAALIEQAVRQREAVFQERDQVFLGALPLLPDGRVSQGGVLLFSAPASPSGDALEQIAWLVRIYRNYLGLIDYSETDTLTRLLNRKTFDEAFERLLSDTPRSPASLHGIERRQGGAMQHWLAVADVDHFKRVNDNFGHLFGDEVLIRVANVMRSAFRDSDRLFRFGGEEFVIMLRVAEQAQALTAAERFRSAIEGHEFPQVGRVTCSLGLTRVAAAEVPSDVLGRADQALYFAKSHGRNQVRVYESLISEGQLRAPAEPSVAADFDIDALFD